MSFAENERGGRTPSGSPSRGEIGVKETSSASVEGSAEGFGAEDKEGLVEGCWAALSSR